MKNIFIILFFSMIAVSCQQKEVRSSVTGQAENLVHHAKGFKIERSQGYSVVTISDPWPGSTETYTYICKRKSGVVPDSLKHLQVINIPISSIAVTSTTHIPSLEMLGVYDKLTAFPNLDYISSEVVRNRIDQGKIRDIGAGRNLNNEIVIDVAPDVIVAHGIDNQNPSVDNLRKSGMKVIFNGDWNEKTPLGKAEWIKLFGTLFDIESKADSVFRTIETEYNDALKLVKNVNRKPTVLSGSMFENTWFVPQGESWGALMLKDAGADYLWADTKGSGSISLPFEKVFDKAVHADVWIGPAEHTSLAGMIDSNPHYARFDAFKSRNVYSFSTKRGRTGGVIYYELSQNRPDLVIKDLIKILHPELLPEHQLFFFEKLK